MIEEWSFGDTRVGTLDSKHLVRLCLGESIHTCPLGFTSTRYHSARLSPLWISMNFSPISIAASGAEGSPRKAIA